VTVLVLALRAPLQSWGSRSRFVRRETELIPTKSGMVGLLAAAQGRRRTDPVEDLVGLIVAARADQPGRVVRDFQTAIADDGNAMPLTHRYYLADAAFTAYIEGPEPVLDGLVDAIRRPQHPLYLGRRSCPPSSPLFLQLSDGKIADVIQSTPWQGSSRSRRKGGPFVALDVQADQSAFPHRKARRQIQDVPLSFNPERREYGMRSVVDLQVSIPNPGYAGAPPDHDPMSD